MLMVDRQSIGRSVGSSEDLQLSSIGNPSSYAVISLALDPNPSHRNFQEPHEQQYRNVRLALGGVAVS